MKNKYKIYMNDHAKVLFFIVPFIFLLCRRNFSIEYEFIMSSSSSSPPSSTPIHKTIKRNIVSPFIIIMTSQLCVRDRHFNIFYSIHITSIILKSYKCHLEIFLSLKFKRIIIFYVFWMNDTKYLLYFLSKGVSFFSN